MANGNKLSQNEVAGFLLGLGIGLVVGLLFQPQLDDYSLAPLADHAAKASGSQLDSKGCTTSLRSETLFSGQDQVA